MDNLLFWTYFVNAVLLINHEIDSAYWKEWELFKIPGGISCFLLLHFPILFLILFGLILVYERNPGGLIISLLLGLSGIFAFSIHTYFIKKGRDEFKTIMSQALLFATLIVSIIQLFLTVGTLLASDSFPMCYKTITSLEIKE